MIEVKWSLAGFTVFYSGKYKDMHSVAKDLMTLAGLNDFSGFGGDWFLVQKESKKLAFMLLKIPSAIDRVAKVSADILDGLRELPLVEFISLGEYATRGEHSAFFSKDHSVLYDLNSEEVAFKVPVSKDFFILLDGSRKRCGFVLVNAIDNLVAENEKRDESTFIELLEKMLYFCDNGVLELMEDGSSSERKAQLELLLSLEDECLKTQEKDGRIFHISYFIKNSKYAFYDIE
ncbi:MAG: hypothetical protein FWD69_09770 [Polyangiaceae bacterium]|nr:hypothetical protein [Polyangiaceae bacterium]